MTRKAKGAFERWISMLKRLDAFKGPDPANKVTITWLSSEEVVAQLKEKYHLPDDPDAEEVIIEILDDLNEGKYDLTGHLEEYIEAFLWDRATSCQYIGPFVQIAFQYMVSFCRNRRIYFPGEEEEE